MLSETPCILPKNTGDIFHQIPIIWTLVLYYFHHQIYVGPRSYLPQHLPLPKSAPGVERLRWGNTDGMSPVCMLIARIQGAFLRRETIITPRDMTPRQPLHC